MIGKSKLPIHEGYCYRNIKKCTDCDEMIDINSKEEHFEEHHKKVACDQCGKEMEVKQLQTHGSVCPNRKQMCTYCNLEVLARDIATHTSHCGSRTGNCQFCNRILKLREMDAHEAGCPEEMRKERERKEADQAKRFKVEEMKKKEERMRQMEMSRIDQERREAEAKRLEQEKERQEKEYQRNIARKEEERRKKDAELRMRDGVRPVPTTSYTNAYSNPTSKYGSGAQPQRAEYGGYDSLTIEPELLIVVLSLHMIKNQQVTKLIQLANQR